MENGLVGMRMDKKNMHYIIDLAQRKGCGLGGGKMDRKKKKEV